MEPNSKYAQTGAPPFLDASLFQKAVLGTAAGLGVHWAWAYLAFFSSKIFFLAGEGSLPRLAWIASMVMAALLFGVCAGLRTRLVGIVTQGRFYILAGALLSGGTLLMAVCPLALVSPDIIVLVAALFCGLGSTFMQLQWGVRLAQLENRQITATALLAFLFAIVVYLVVALGLVSTLAVVVVVLVPLASPLLLYNAGPFEMAGAQASVARLRPGLLVGIFLFQFVSTLIRSLFVDAQDSSFDSIQALWLAVAGGALVILLVAFAIAKRLPSAVMAYFGVLPFMTAGLSVLAVSGFEEGGKLANCFVFVGHVVFSVFIWISLARHSRADLPSLIGVFAIGLAMTAAGSGLGGIFGSVVGEGLAGQQSGTIWTVTSCVLLMVLVVVVPFTFPLGKEGASTSNRRNDTEKKGRGAHDDVVSQLATEHFLTERETDVLGLLAQGYSSKKIQQTLTIAQGTVNSHVRNIYQKLGVHSRDELIELIEDFDPAAGRSGALR
ncbi:helix-turn-helix transcriptional regulator [Adlercreutzia sp. R21]|uniref:response regulator transcription factor n=1 Tax=Adlercreutzia wanghongyangiae TaxID=3111451 RepID=UPI002DBDA3AF|nr:helix-turn-helix transcriptional regulator [Adlercreutzia sp. R21]MEC4184152.1 helix-turn-helix transcriptional regulator [Adlercreutzia sp. R21]